MTPEWQLPRYGTLWLLCSFVLAVTPLLLFLPLWLGPLAAMALGWRVLVYRGRVGAPGSWLRAGLVLLCVAGLFASFDRPYGLEPMATLLVAAYALKLLELKGKRDALVTLFLGFFVAAVLALFDQRIITGLYLLVPLTALLAALSGIHHSDNFRQPLRPLRVAATLLAQAVPLMLVLFLVLPRLGPLWSVPTTTGGARTGMSDTLSPGDFTRLGRSSEVAFRVRFEGGNPGREQLYWRGLTFSRFDGRSWSRAEGWGYGPGLVQWQGAPAHDWFAAMPRQGRTVDYEVIVEPTRETWLYALGTPEPMTSGVGVTPDATLVSRVPVGSRMAYQARSWLDSGRDQDGLSAIRRRIELSYPSGANPETRRIARQWAAESPTPQALIERVLALYNASFHYTLSPPALGRHSVDEFLWQTRSGFCEHFASSFVFFMRAAGIPARVVAGYQGGEWNQERNYLTVRQYDAHAWAEIWLQGQGWVRVDPTAAVAPERISAGAMEALEEEQAESPFSMHRLSRMPLLNQLRLQLDYLDYAWGRWVLGYQHRQADLLSGWLGRIDYARLALLLLGAGALALLPALWFALRDLRRSPVDPLDHWYGRFCRKMAQAGLPRRPGEGPRDFARRCRQSFPGRAREVDAITRCYERQRFGGETVASDQLKRLVKGFKA